MINWKPAPANLELKPGMLVKTVDGRIKLVGHINLQAGYCGCCDADVIRYSEQFVGEINNMIRSNLTATEINDYDR